MYIVDRMCLSYNGSAERSTMKMGAGSASANEIKTKEQESGIV